MLCLRFSQRSVSRSLKDCLIISSEVIGLLAYQWNSIFLQWADVVCLSTLEEIVLFVFQYLADISSPTFMSDCIPSLNVNTFTFHWFGSCAGYMCNLDIFWIMLHTNAHLWATLLILELSVSARVLRCTPALKHVWRHTSIVMMFILCPTGVLLHHNFTVTIYPAWKCVSNVPIYFLCYSMATVCIRVSMRIMVDVCSISIMPLITKASGEYTSVHESTGLMEMSVWDCELASQGIWVSSAGLE